MNDKLDIDDSEPESGIYITNNKSIKNGKCPCTVIILERSTNYNYFRVECTKCSSFCYFWWNEDISKKHWLSFGYKKAITIKI